MAFYVLQPELTSSVWPHINASKFSCAVASSQPYHCPAGPPPLYIGFGSLVVDQPSKLTEMFLTAIKRTGLRAIIQRGWGGLGTGYGGPNGRPTPPDVLFIDSAPHDWLFQCVSAVVHHGGAGTTATGLLAGQCRGYTTTGWKVAGLGTLIS
jgi:UDP:flavonoid glycosyltransferase YjiC (YdhE family)